MTGPRIKAIETAYAGVLFRSRLEARWAVFMDAVKQKWEYEPERIALPGGGTYLPDFRTAGGGYIEVKGTESNLEKQYVIRAAAVLGNLAILGPIPECRNGSPVRTYLDNPAADGDVMKVRMLRVWFDYRPYDTTWSGEEVASNHGMIESVDIDHWLDPPLMNSRKCKGNCPYDAARGARFEHGESGAVR